MTLRGLMAEIKDASSPLHGFFEERFSNTAGICRRFAAEAGDLLVPSSGAPAGTIGTASDWLLRFLVNPHPDVDLAMVGAAKIGVKMMLALADLSEAIGATLRRYTGGWVSGPGDAMLDHDERFLELTGPLDPASSFLNGLTFDGPVAGSTTDPGLLASVLGARVAHGRVPCRSRGALARPPQPLQPEQRRCMAA